MDINPVVLSIPIYFLLIGIEILVQQFTKKKLYRLNDAVTNISCGITQQLSGLFFKVFSVGVYQFFYENFAIWDIPTSWLSLIVLFIGVDFFYYWGHRKSHEINLFWGGHVVHHQSEDYNLSVALRQSSFQVIWTFAFYLPLAVIGFNTLAFVLINGLTTVYQFWIHTETIGKLGVFETIFNTPSHHRVHHGRDPKYIDKNHAGVFIIWDKMFGTFQKEEEKPVYGITRPLNSWNPVWANFEHYHFMLKEWKTIKGFGNKLKYLFNKPGWLPNEMGGYRAPQKISQQDVNKYDLKASSQINFYVLFQYLLALVGTAVFLFNQQGFDLPQKLLFTLAIVITIVNCGALFENKPWISLLEYLRIMIFSASGVFISFMNGWNIPILTISIGYFLLSNLWMVSINRKRVYA